MISGPIIKYRSDIDGLRAVAVLPIVLFHAGYEWISGGFIGVDIFFVISGYLISSIILNDVALGRFSYARFYERRIRRIVPALLLVLLATLAAGYFVLLPAEYIDLAQSALAAAAFVPNVYFWATSSTYFGLDIAITPLLHTWSLGIEEQFYIAFPALAYLLASRCTRRVMVWILSSLLVFSLAANLLVVQANAKFAFYMIPTRAWELLAGVFLSLGVLPQIKKLSTATVLSLLGAVLIVLPMFVLDETSLFPGINAVPPVLGTALIIYSGEHHQTIVSRILSLKALVAIGLISYSLYLWHWPVTVYTNMYWESALNRPFVVALSVALAYLSYRFIETRFRHSAHVPTPAGRPRELALGAVLVSVACLGVIITVGLPHRVPADAWEVVAHKAGSWKDSCRQFTNNPEYDADICMLGNSETEPSFLIWGDSHARSIATALDIAATELGTSGVLIHGCRPLRGVYRKGEHQCQHLNEEVLRFINSRDSLERIFLAGYWRIPFLGQGYDNSSYLIMDDETVLRSPAENQRVFGRGLERTVTALKDRDVIVIQDIPEVGSQFGKSVANHIARRVWLGSTTAEELVFQAGIDSFEQDIQLMVTSLLPGSRYLEVKPFLCADDDCPLLNEGKLIYRDGDHLSEYGASLLVPVFLRYLTDRNAAFVPAAPPPRGVRHAG
ncbi:MAG: acyltransferase family protein [Gammaproteobacteria bacterium]